MLTGEIPETERCLMYADDVVICAETKVEVKHDERLNNSELWKLVESEPNTWTIIWSRWIQVTNGEGMKRISTWSSNG